MKLVLIRHGYSLANEQRVLSGHFDVELSEKGILHLKNLKETVSYPETDYYATSHLLRTQQTFNILFEGKEINKIDERFAEINFREFERKSFDDIDLDDFFGKLYTEKQVGNVETLDELYNRMENGLIDLITELQEKGLNSATIVSHSTAIRIIVVHATTNDLNTFRTTRPKNGLGYILDVDVVDGKLVYNSCLEITA